jgi:diguanylate cyclase (GGDEF)-like protein
MAPPAVLAAKMKAMARIAALRAELTQANLKLEALANQDGLTGLFNRRYLDLRLEHIWNDALRRGDSLGLLMLDVDCFKKYNDRYGHLAGDDCLRAVATAMAVAVDRLQVGRVIQSGFAARYGGEEFAVVLPLVSWPELAQVADALLAAVRGMAMNHEGNSGWGVVTLSLGAAWQPRAEGDLPAFIRQADARLYRAKQKGRNRGELE